MFKRNSHRLWEKNMNDGEFLEDLDRWEDNIKMNVKKK
jgi:hypothetical protein